MRQGYFTSSLIDTIAAKTTTGSVNKFNLSKFSTYKGRGFGRSLVGFFITLPISTFAITADCNLDGVSIAQLIAALTFTLSAKSPPALGYDGGHMICQSLAGDILLDSLGWIANVRTIVGRGQNAVQFPAGAADLVTIATAQAILTEQRSDPGWLLNQGPYGVALGAASFSDQVVLFLPFGLQYKENESSTAIPNHWFNGELGAPGELSLILGQNVDNNAVTWTAGNIELRALEWIYPLAECPRPTVPHIEVNSDSSKNIRIRNGVRSLLAFRKDLTAAGAMATLSYTTVDVQNDGESMIDSVVTNNIIDQNAIVEREGFKFSIQATTKVNMGQARVTRPGIPILANDRSKVKHPGMEEADAECYLKVLSSAETQFQTWDITFIPRTPAYEAACTATNLVPSIGGTSSTKNGNLAPDDVAMLIPGKTVVAKTGGK